MWVTQSYLSIAEPNAKVFVYYIYEEYKHEQINFTKSLQKYLEKLGDFYGDEVSLLIPNDKYIIDIGMELKGVDELWVKTKNHLPGLLISNYPLSDFNKNYFDAYLIPLNSTSEELAHETLFNIKKTIKELIKIKENDLFHKFYEAIELKINLPIFSIDLKKII